MNSLRVKDAMTHLVVRLRPEDKIPEAAKRLFSNRISGAPVVRNGRLIGVVSEADLVGVRNTTVGDVMTTKDVISITPDESIWEAARLIDRHGVRRLPVVDESGYVVGVLTRSDLVRCMARSRELDWQRNHTSLISAGSPANANGASIMSYGSSVRVGD